MPFLERRLRTPDDFGTKGHRGRAVGWQLDQSLEQSCSSGQSISQSSRCEQDDGKLERCARFAPQVA